MDSPEYNVYMNIQQEINLEIKKEFEKRGINFAFPTQTLYMKNLNASPAASDSPNN